MDGFYTDKKYESFKIQDQSQAQRHEVAKEIPQTKPSEPISLDEGLFYEIEYDSCPMPGVGKFVLKSQKITEYEKIAESKNIADPEKIAEPDKITITKKIVEPANIAEPDIILVTKKIVEPEKITMPEKDEKRDLFRQMREISRAQRLVYNNSRFFDWRVQQDNAFIFYKQGMFMKDFSDNYSENVEFSQYFPYYQLMGYEQLRTYFTWRTEVRKGNVADTSLSYAFLYLYELLGNIGVSNPEDGLNQLMSFWKAFANFNKSIDKYVLKWLKDYHIYYELPHTFKDFIDQNNLTSHYPKIMNTEDKFNMFCNLSRYDIRKSTFFTDGNEKLITDCFYFVMNKLKELLKDNGINLNETLFQPTKKMSEWKPFKDALFYPWLKQPDRRIVLSENEIFICNNNKWSFNSVITSESGRKLIGYMMKQMEVALRKVTSYKYKLSASINTVTHEAVGKLKNAGLSLETIINNAVSEFYKEATKTVVIVDHEALSRIRQEALDTQEKLIVPEQDKMQIPIIPALNQTKQLIPVNHSPKQANHPTPDNIEPIQLDLSMIFKQDMPSIVPSISPTIAPSMPPPDILPTSVSDPWWNLKNTLTEIEIKALSVVLHGETELKRYADECGMMLEVLVDGINEKAMDFISDNLLDEEFALYDDYKKQVKELIG